MKYQKYLKKENFGNYQKVYNFWDHVYCKRDSQYKKVLIHIEFKKSKIKRP